jgi:hypothetical protein
MPSQAKVKQFEERLGELHAKGMRGTMSRIFRKYTTALCEPDYTFDNLYLEGLFATGTDPRPLRRRDRFRLLLQQFERTLALDGRVAECGCFRGLSSYLLCSRLRAHDSRFDGTGHEIYDSFEGLSEPLPEDDAARAEEAVARSTRRGMFAHPLEAVQRALNAFPNISYGVGWIPEAFPQDGRRYRFVHVDVDLYQPTKASLEHFWPHLVPGGLMVCDDYNWPGAKRAVEEFAAASGATFMVTPSNQAVFAKA